MKKIISPHDRAFRSAMGNKQVAIEFFEYHLPDEVKKAIDFTSLKLCQETFIDEELQLTASDVLYSVKLLENKTTSYLYILSEHQRKPDDLMPLRIIKYTCEIMASHRKQHPEDKTLPLVVPLVFYHGKKPYPYKTDIKELIRAPESLINSVLFQPFTLIDAHELSDEELLHRQWIGLMQLIFKHIDQNLSDWFPKCFTLCKSIDQAGGGGYVLTLMNYVFQVGEGQNSENMLKLLADDLSNETREQIMTIAEQLRQEGEATILTRLLTKKFGDLPKSYLQRIQTADAKKLLEWSDQIFVARTIEEVFH